MKGQGLAPKKRQIRTFLKRDRVLPQQSKDALAAHPRQRRFNTIRVEPVWLLSLKTKDHGLVCPVTSSCRTERAEELATHTPGAFEQAALAQRHHEHAGRAHRPHRVRA